MSWHQYVLMQRGYWNKQNRVWEDDWKRTREIVWLLYNSNVKKEDQACRSELISLPSDGVASQTSPSKEQDALARQKAEEKATLAFFNAMAAFDVSEN